MGILFVDRMRKISMRGWEGPSIEEKGICPRSRVAHMLILFRVNVLVDLAGCHGSSCGSRDL
jgi:hypothetical protein